MRKMKSTTKCSKIEFSEIANEEFKHLKSKNLDISRYLEFTDYFKEKADVIRHCNDFVQYSITADGEVRVTNSFCRERLCPTCQRARSNKLYANARKIIDYFNGKYDYILITLTAKNVKIGNLSDTITKLNTASRKLFGNERIKRSIKGSWRTLEVTYNAERNDYHPHIHALCAVPKSYFNSRLYISQADYLALWRSLYSGSFDGGVNVQRVRDYGSGIAEVCKYSVKPFEFDENLPFSIRVKVIDELFTVLKGRRLLQLFGVFRSARAELKLTEELENPPPSKSDKVYYYSFNHKLMMFEGVGLS